MQKPPPRNFPTRWKTVVPRHGKPTRYLWVVWHPQNLRLGRFTDIGAYTYLQALEGIEIGDHAQIGSHCAFYSVSTIDGKKGKIVIGPKARIGSHSVIMPGVKIGANTVVGAMSFVNRSLPANAVAWGCPVRIVKKRKKS